MAERGYIEVDGYREFRRAVRRSVDRDLPRRMGEAHRKTGEFIVGLVRQESDPRAIGEGRGAELRSSAAKREVLLRGGGAHRKHRDPQVVKRRQWGRIVVAPFQHAPDRPYVKRIAERRNDEIGQFFLRSVSRAMDPAFYDTEP